MSGEYERIFIAVPFQDLRDSGWPEDMEKWYGEVGAQAWIFHVRAECYASLSKIEGEDFDLVILDEAHHLTPLNAQFFHQNKVGDILGLTATPPRDATKNILMQNYCPVVFTYPLDQGVADGIISDFEIHVIEMDLDQYSKVIDAGTKAKPFKTTEQKHYEYLTTNLNKMFMLANKDTTGKYANLVKFAMMKRARFIYNLPSKTAMAKQLMDKLTGKGKRTLIFCGSIEQSRLLCGINVYNSEDKKNDMLQRFKDKEIDTLGVVNAVNEGQNIPELDQLLIVQANSSDRDLVQRIGRAVRLRVGHVAKVYILCVRNTVDETWITKAMAAFDPQRIHYHSAKRLPDFP